MRVYVLSNYYNDLIKSLFTYLFIVFYSFLSDQSIIINLKNKITIIYL